MGVHSTTTQLERFWSKVAKGPNDKCWQWLASDGAMGYGKMWFAGQLQYAHRISYMLAHGAIPLGMTIDHLCRDHGCVNPNHLEPVSHQVNVLRGRSPSAINAKKVNCKVGHPYDLFNTRIRVNGGRGCRICQVERDSKRQLVPETYESQREGA